VTASVPVIEHYDAMDKVRKISAVPPPDDVYNAVKKVLLDAGFKPTNPSFDFDFVVKAQTDVADGTTSAVEVTPEVGEIVSKSTESEPIDGREAEVLEPADSA